jgi:hypothetical protein
MANAVSRHGFSLNPKRHHHHHRALLAEIAGTGPAFTNLALGSVHIFEALGFYSHGSNVLFLNVALLLMGLNFLTKHKTSQIPSKAEEQSRTCGCQSGSVEDQPQCPGV